MKFKDEELTARVQRDYVMCEDAHEHHRAKC